ncbi:MAG: PIN domain-containing protein [Sphingopyxis sp.]|uniref:type II toxin-antitoxin system VapC family toxin n=1 Tax=Sphingopyxis sp. TaxID=1908224 RepID=UPI0032F08DF3
MAGTKPIIYVDTCVFIAMLTGEQRKDDESLHVAGFAAELERREVIAVTSALTKTEILECTLTDQQRTTMERLIRPPKVQRKDVSSSILDLATEIRNFYQEERRSGRSNLPTVETPDAIHLATAIYYDCPRMFTFDENDRDETTKRPKRGLIPLSGIIAGRYSLVIQKPFSTSMGFAF